jgi:rare lipoprotein A (peptidoglycan hydrolase)
VQQRSAQIEARLTRNSSQLDEIIAEQSRAKDRLSTRAQAIYRIDDTSFISVLMGASTFQEFVTRWELLTRIGSEDARVLRELEIARAKAERSSKTLLRLQDQSARALNEVAREAARARREFAASQSALRAYQARTATSGKQAGSSAKSAPKALKGSGAWKTAVASHYGRNFHGRGASGEEIGPYSMMVAHKTLPFGTLIEFEYDGKRAVARVADRGPRSAERDFDLGPGVVRVLDFSGVHEVRYRIIKR